MRGIVAKKRRTPRGGHRGRINGRYALRAALAAVAFGVAAWLAVSLTHPQPLGPEVHGCTVPEVPAPAAPMGLGEATRQKGEHPIVGAATERLQLPDAVTVASERGGQKDATARTNHVLSYRSGGRAAEHIKSVPDQMLAFMAQGADMPGELPPLPLLNSPDGGNAEFLASLTNEIAILDDDPPRLRRQKEIMIDFRRQIKEIVDNGGTFEGAIREYHDWVNECANLRLAAIREYQALRSEDPDAAEEYRLRANAELEAAGAVPINQAGSGRRRR